MASGYSMQFQVPQFIDVAPKIVGPLTIKQFLYLAGAGVPIFLLFFVLQFWLWIIIAAILGSVALALAFLKINGQPIARVLIAAFNYFWEPRFYLWKRAGLPTASKPVKPPREFFGMTPLKNLLLKITTSTAPIAKREKPSKLFFSAFKFNKEVYETFQKTTGEREKARRVDYR